MKIGEKEKIRVLHCIETISSGGVEQTRLTLIRGLDKQKFDHKIICTWAGGFVAQELEKDGIEIIQVGAFKRAFELKKLFKVIKAVKAYKPHIIHGGVFEGMTMATFGGVFGRVPVVILEETSDPQNRSVKANFLLKIYSLFADKVQAISPEVGQYLKEITKINPAKIRIITNGVSIPNISNEKIIHVAKKQYGIGEKDFVVGFVGRLFNEHKRITDLVEAISILDIDDIKLLIVGEGKDKINILNLVKEIGIENKVIFAGYQADPHLFYDLMDVLCVPSSREGFGLVAVEGMLHSLPIIASKVGGLQKVVSHGETGFIVSPHSPKEISEKIHFLYLSPTEKKSMGEKGRERALKEYSSKRYVTEVEDMYTALLSKH